MKNHFVFITFIFLHSFVLAQQKGAHSIPAQNPTEAGNTYAVVVGISDYQDPAIPDLRFADKDAEAFAKFLRSKAGGSLDEDHLKMLINSEATMAQFANALDWLWEVCKEGDQAIIYFSGHGDVEKKSLTQPGFLLCWDAPARVYMAGGAFALPMLQEVVSTLSVQNKAKVIVITDACRSGTLAGSSVGGAQATASNLAKQFANEIKIMSCQPNEYSIEGEQWGGGRGAFSYHLLEALYGMADNNNDLWVTLQEVGRYLEDHVSNEVAPVSQVPMVVGNRNERLVEVDEHLLASIKSGKTNQMSKLSAIESRGIEEDVLSKLDTNVKVMYQLFKSSLKNKVFLEPTESCANTYYEQLINEPKLERLHATMKRNYAAALQDDAQQVINAMLKSNINENVLTNFRTKAEQYNLYPRNLDKAAELLGPQHYMYNSLKARKYFFEGIALATFHSKESSIIGDIPDRNIASKVLSYYRKALDYQSDLSYVFMNIGLLYGYSFQQMDSVEHYFQLTIKNTPSWILAFTSLYDILKSKNLTRARMVLEQAQVIDSNAALVLYKWGEFYRFIRQNDSAEKKLLQLLDQKDLGFCTPCVHIALGNVYLDTRRFVEAEKEYQTAYQMDSTLDPIFINFTRLYINLNHFDKAESMALRQLQRHPGRATTYNLLGDIYRITGRYEQAESNYRKSINLDSTYVLPYFYLGAVYLTTQRYQEAESIYLLALRKFPLDGNLMGNLGSTYLGMGRLEEAEKIIQNAISLNPNIPNQHFELALIYLLTKRYDEAIISYHKVIQLDPANPIAYYNLACVFSLKNNMDEAFTQLELAIQKGFNEYNDLQNDKDLENLKADKERWDALMKKYFPE